MKRLVIYHANCADGFGAAWCAWHRFGRRSEYVPAQYGDAPPDCTGRDVYVLDFSFPRETLIAMSKQASSLIVLDHHKSAEAALSGLPFARFSSVHSGARMAFDYWRKFQLFETEGLINYIQDRDLWTWALPESRAVSAWLSSFEFDFSTWDDLSFKLATEPKQVFAEGAAILRAADQYVARQVPNAAECGIAGHVVPIINATHCVSELVGRLAEGKPFAVSWFERQDGKFVYSLRSREGGIDVSEVAKQFGGGGHRNAAGFTLDFLLHRVPA